jgi:tyrosyl-tRNA synthetase
MVKSEFLQRLNERGFIHQATDMAALDALMSGGACVPAYIGFDCTAPSLHVGSLMQIMILRHLQQCGHKPIVLLGGFTTKIGDPSGKDASRNALDDATIAKNKAGIQSVFEKFLTFGDGEADAVLVDNDDWLGQMNLGEFLRDVGAKFSVNRMVKMDSVRLRLERESHLSFLEFSYMLMQSYDFVELNQRYGCRLQIGGSDQWGNIVMGADLFHKTLGLEPREYSSMPEGWKEENTLYFPPIKAEPLSPDFQSDPELRSFMQKTHKKTTKDNELKLEKGVYGLTTPLLITSSGAKMGKTADGAVWLNPDMLSPYD